MGNCSNPDSERHSVLTLSFCPPGGGRGGGATQAARPGSLMTRKSLGPPLNPTKRRGEKEQIQFLEQKKGGSRASSKTREAYIEVVQVVSVVLPPAAVPHVASH